jgi:hypothetical protein
MRDFAHSVGAVHSLAPAPRTATANGTGVDLLGYGAAAVLATVGAWTDGTHTLKLQESSDNSTWTDVAAIDLAGAFTPVSSAAGQNASQKVSYIGNRRYIRAVLTVAGATTGAVVGVLVLRGRAAVSPVA